MNPSYYTEPLAHSEPMRRCYADSVAHAVEVLRASACAQRQSCITPQAMADDPERFRAEFGAMLGMPVLEQVFGTGVPEIEAQPVGQDAQCTVTRLKIRLYDSVSFTGLLFCPAALYGAAPLVIASHGGGGSPELCADMVGENNYNHMVRRLLDRGAIVFAPQLLLWNCSASVCEGRIPHYATPYDRIKMDNALKQCGASIAGFEIYAIRRTLDALLRRPDIAPAQCSMIGLSYGGFYTLYTMACETRIRSGYAAGFFNDRVRYGWGDMIWNGAAARFLDPEVAGLCAPRKLWLEVGRADAVFDVHGAEGCFGAARAFYEAQGAPERVRLNVWDGGHTLSPDNAGLDFLLGDSEPV